MSALNPELADAITASHAGKQEILLYVLARSTCVILGSSVKIRSSVESALEIRSADLDLDDACEQKTWLFFAAR